MAKYKGIITLAIVAIIAVVIYLIVRNITNPETPDEQEEVKCGSKPVFRYKYPSKAFPVFANDYNAEIKLTSDILKKISDSAGSLDIGVDIKNKVVELQQKLNQENISFSTGLKNYFFSVNADPCNDTLRMRYVMFTEEMSRRMLEFRNITSQITTISEKGTEPDIPVSVDTASPTVTPPFKLLTDTAKLRNSLLKLNDAIINNKSINTTIINRKLPVK